MNLVSNVNKETKWINEWVTERIDGAYVYKWMGQ